MLICLLLVCIIIPSLTPDHEGVHLVLLLYGVPVLLQLTLVVNHLSLQSFYDALTHHVYLLKALNLFLAYPNYLLHLSKPFFLIRAYISLVLKVFLQLINLF
jgi:hypothetical protein